MVHWVEGGRGWAPLHRTRACRPSHLSPLLPAAAPPLPSQAASVVAELLKAAGSSNELVFEVGGGVTGSCVCVCACACVRVCVCARVFVL